MSETNTPEQSPLNEGTNGDHDKPQAPNLNVDPDITTDGGPDADGQDEDED